MRSFGDNFLSCHSTLEVTDGQNLTSCTELDTGDSVYRVYVHQWKRRKDRARVQRATRKVTAHGPPHGTSAMRGLICVWGLRISRKAKVLLKLDRSNGSSVGSEEEETEEQQLYNFIYATLYLLSHPSHCQVTAAYCDPKGKHTHTHIFSQLENTL